MTDMHDTADLVSKALRRAWQLGQTYWQQADSEYQSHWKKADATQATFDQLVEDTRAAILTSNSGTQPAPIVPDFANTKDAARYRWLRENGLANEKRESRAVLPRSGKKASMAFRYWTTPEELDMTIDAMLSAEAKP